MIPRTGRPMIRLSCLGRSRIRAKNRCTGARHERSQHTCTLRPAVIPCLGSTPSRSAISSPSQGVSGRSLADAGLVFRDCYASLCMKQSSNPGGQQGYAFSRVNALTSIEWLHNQGISCPRPDKPFKLSRPTQPHATNTT